MLRDGSARRHAARVRGRAGRARSACWSAASGCGVRSSTSAATSRPAASRACCRLAFAPDYARSGRFYVYFTDRNGSQRVQEFRRSAGSANRADKRHAPAGDVDGGPVPEPQRRAAAVRPRRLLYIGTGDGGSGGDPENRAQNLDSLLGKILRIDPRGSGSSAYRSPASNPFVGRGRAKRDLRLRPAQPVALLVRPPHGRPLHRRRRARTRVEEIDFARRGEARGRNYGWSCFEGTPRATTLAQLPGRRRPGARRTGAPAASARSPGAWSCATRRCRSSPAATCTATSARGQPAQLPDRGRPGRPTTARSACTSSSLSSFGEDARGRVYATSLDGPVYRLRSGTSASSRARLDRAGRQRLDDRRPGRASRRGWLIILCATLPSLSIT